MEAWIQLPGERSEKRDLSGHRVTQTTRHVNTRPYYADAHACDGADRLLYHLNLCGQVINTFFFFLTSSSDSDSSDSDWLLSDSLSSSSSDSDSESL